jgi:cysteine desulfurase
VAEPRIYLDHAATTPILPEARAAMTAALDAWHNPSSPHAEGRAAKAALEQSRRRIAEALGWSGSVIFTSGASEALAIALGRGKGDGRFVSAVEHDAVFRAAPDAVLLPMDGDGRLLTDGIGGSRPVVAVQHANNETGIVQPLDEIAAIVRAKGGLLVADCAQTAGKLPLPDADMIAISAHKFGGPPGVGALLVRDLGMIEAMGGQEQGYRPGTQNLPGISAMCAALEASSEWMRQAIELRVYLERMLRESGAEVIGASSLRIPTIGAYRMPGVPANAQLIQFDLAGIAVSAGSACSSGSLKPSHVLSAMGWPAQAASEVIRVSFGRNTNAAEVDRFAAFWLRLAARRRAA